MEGIQDTETPLFLPVYVMIYHLTKRESIEVLAYYFALRMALSGGINSYQKPFQRSNVRYISMVDVFSVAPEIEVPSQLYGVGPGSDVTITCKVQAFPKPILFWMKNDNMLLDG